jgi:hypothetical protein
MWTYDISVSRILTSKDTPGGRFGRAIILETFKGRRQVKKVTMAKTKLNDGQTLYAVNDFFIGQKTHVSARYLIYHGSRSEPQSSSDIIISTGLGSTGWLHSVLTGTAALANRNVKPAPKLNFRSLGWDADQLYFSVREPFPSKTSPDIKTGLTPVFIFSMIINRLNLVKFSMN